MKKTIGFLAMVMAVASVSAQQPGNRLNPMNRLNRPSLTRNAPPTAAQATQNRQNRNAGPSAPAASGEAPALNWDQAPVDIVLQAYGERLNKTILKDPGCQSATITLKSKQGQKLTDAEYLEAIEVVLEMNGIHLEPYGEKFIRALPRKSVRKEGIPLIMDMEQPLKESGRVVSMMIPFKNISYEQAQKIIEQMKSDSGSVLSLERTNSILVTDTEQNINRILEVVRTVDVSKPIDEKVFVYQVANASAEEIKTALETIVTESLKEQEQDGKGVNNAVRQQQPQSSSQRMTLLGRNKQQERAPESLVASVTDADRGMIRGKVLILADERSNKLIIITSQSNYDFFETVIKQLDVETTPDTVVKVYRLKYADSEDVSDMINDLIGNSQKSNTKDNQNAAAKGKSGGSSLRNAGQTAAKKPANQRSGEAKAGELSKDNTTVLSDKRINGLVVMTQKDLVPVVESIIEAMDIKLSQVLIETMILQVNISDDISTGIDWVHKIKSGPLRWTQDEQGNWVQELVQDQVISGGGGSGIASLSEAATETAVSSGSGGLSYYFLDKGLDIGAIISASKTDSRTKLVASPIIMTVDNKEATIEATRMRYLLKGYTYSGSTYNGSAVPDYEQKEIGLTVKVTPKINPNGTVMLEIEEEFSSIGDNQTIQAATGGTSNNTQVVGGISVETTVTRKLSADITVENRNTVILGGLSQIEKSQVESGIPILKDIPWIGRYLFGSTKDTETRQELLMFLTPYVLDDAESAIVEAHRRKTTMSDAKPWDDHGWSASPLADPVGLKEQLKRKQREWKAQDEDYESKLKLEEANEERAEKLMERAEKAAEKRAEEAKKIVEKINAAEEKKAEARTESELKVREDNAGLLEELKSEGEKAPKAEAAQ